MKLAYKLRFLPMVAGFIASFIGFSWFGAASIPYQDMDPALYQKYLHQVETAQFWFFLSLAALAAGILYYFAIKALYKKYRKRNEHTGRPF